MRKIIQTAAMIFVALSFSASAVERYTDAEKTFIKTTLAELSGKQKKCVVSFISGYEFYAYPHCVQHNKDKKFCKKYKTSVPMSVIDTAFDICGVEWVEGVNLQ